MILGPALGGFLSIAGPAPAYALGACVFFAAAGLVVTIPRPARKADRAPATFGAALDGLRFIRRRPVIFGAISLDLFSVLLGGATALLPVFARDILGVGAVGLGVMRAAPSVGALAMSLTLTRRPLGHGVGHTLFAAVGIFGLCTVVFGLSHSFALSVVALVGLGASDMIVADFSA